MKTDSGKLDVLADLFVNYGFERIIYCEENIYLPGDCDERIYYVPKSDLPRTAYVRESKTFVNGYKLFVRFIGPDDFFGESVLYNDERGLIAEAMQEFKCYVMRKESFSEFLVDSKYSGAWNEFLTRRLRETENLLKFKRSDLAIQKRVAEVLQFLGEEYGVKEHQGEQRITEINVKLTHQILSEMVGASRENVTLAMGYIRDTGAIEYGRYHTTIVNAGILSEIQEGLELEEADNSED